MESEKSDQNKAVKVNPNKTGRQNQNPDQVKIRAEKEDKKAQEKQKKYEGLWENCEWVNLAIKFAYIGLNYNGFEASVKAQLPFIEDKIFHMLQKTKLIKQQEEKDTQKQSGYLSLEYNYKKCGRTDKGVSAAGNVINLLVRDDGSNINTYRGRLNSGLPRDIRVQDCARVDNKFNSRMDCTEREYRYYFMKKNYDLDIMEKAAQKLKGEHDFRNFCKLNQLATTNHVRTITDVGFGKADFQYQEVNEKIKGFNNYFEMYYMSIKGSAFLWHMIRCIMAVLFEIGEGEAEIGVVDELLDVQKTPSRPGYSLAPPENLILWACQFPKEKCHFDTANMPDLETLGWMDITNIFMEEISSQFININLFGSMFMSRAITTKNDTIEKLNSTNYPLRGKDKKKVKLIDQPKCKTVQQEAEALLKKKVNDDTIFMTKIRKLLKKD